MEGFLGQSVFGEQMGKWAWRRGGRGEQGHIARALKWGPWPQLPATSSVKQGGRVQVWKKW